MTDNEIKKALDILDRFDLFGGQRAGRELWNEKPVDVQNEDIENFVKDVVFLKDLINRLQAENERLKAECGNQSVLWSKHYEALFETAKETTKAEAYKEFANRLKEKYGYYDWENKCIVYPEDEIDNLLKEKVGEDK